jgi:hypothetical protein
MKPVQLLALLLISGCAPSSAQTRQTAPAATSGPTAEEIAIMDRLEPRGLRMPRGAGPLSSYTRYYAWQARGDGARRVVAVWVNLAGEPPGRHWVTEREFPLIFDGGCSVITLSYDVATRYIEHITCNGDA